jgi:hypothetical protein
MTVLDSYHVELITPLVANMTNEKGELLASVRKEEYGSSIFLFQNSRYGTDAVSRMADMLHEAENLLQTEFSLENTQFFFGEQGNLKDVVKLALRYGKRLDWTKP